MLPANDDVRPLGPFITLVPKQRRSLRMHLDLTAIESDGDKGVDQGLLILEARFALNVMGHFVSFR